MKNDSEERKKVDEDWKRRIDEERGRAKGEPPAGGKAPSSPAPDRPAPAAVPPEAEASKEPSVFLGFLSSLTMQALMGLGEIPNPVTRSVELDLEGARHWIEILATLKEKTEGHCTLEETQFLDHALYELHMKFAQKSGGV